MTERKIPSEPWTAAIGELAATTVELVKAREGNSDAV
jgi:hypothetical protein